MGKFRESDTFRGQYPALVTLKLWPIYEAYLRYINKFWVQLGSLTPQPSASGGVHDKCAYQFHLDKIVDFHIFL